MDDRRLACIVVAALIPLQATLNSRAKFKMFLISVSDKKTTK